MGTIRFAGLSLGSVAAAAVLTLLSSGCGGGPSTPAQTSTRRPAAKERSRG